MVAFLPLRAAPSGVPFEGTNQNDTLLWDTTAKAWFVGPGGGGGAVTSVFGRVGAVVAQTGDYDSDEVTNVSGVAGASVSDALDTLAAAQAPQAAPLRHTLYVDPSATSFPGVLTPGTILTPYTLLQDAIDATSAGAQWTIVVPPGVGIGENIVIPSTAGTSIEIVCEGLDQGGILNGTITWDANDGFLGLTNLYVADQITGTATAESTLIVQNCFLQQTIAFGGSLVHVYINGTFPTNGNVGFSFAKTSGNILTTGDVFAVANAFVGTAFQARNAYLTDCWVGLTTTTTFTLSGTLLRLVDTQSNVIGDVTFSGAAGVVQLDGVSASDWDASAHTVTNGTVLRENCPQGGVYAWFAEEFDNGSQGAGPYTVDFTNGQNQVITVTANTAIELAFPPGCGTYRLRVIQGGAGGFTPTFTRDPSGDVYKPGGSLSFTAAAGSIDILNIYNQGADAFVTVINDFQV